MPVSPGTKQNSFLGWSVKVEQRKVNISRYCFPRRKFVKIMLPGTTSHLLQTSMINYEFNNHLSTMLCVINWSPVSASCNLFSGQEVWTPATITLQTMYFSLLSPLTPSLPSHLISDYRVSTPVKPEEKMEVTGVNSSQPSTYRIYLTALQTDSL